MERELRVSQQEEWRGSAETSCSIWQRPLRALMGRALVAVMVMVLGYSANAGAFVIDTCIAGGCVPGVPTQGWDGPGLGSFNLGYYIGNPNRADNGFGGLAEATIENAFLAAAASWSSVVQVSFTKAGDATLGAAGFNNNNSISFYFHGGANDTTDGLGFDGAWNPGTGAGSVFAHAWGPSDIMSESTAGNMHFDNAESWVTNGAAIGGNSATIDLQSVILHELGHALGLGHEDALGQGLIAPVMQSFYWGEQRSLRADDIAGAQSLYCPTGQNCAAGPVIPEPSTIVLLGAGIVGLVVWGRKRISK